MDKEELLVLIAKLKDANIDNTSDKSHSIIIESAENQIENLPISPEISIVFEETNQEKVFAIVDYNQGVLYNLVIDEKNIEEAKGMRDFINDLNLPMNYQSPKINKKIQFSDIINPSDIQSLIDDKDFMKSFKEELQTNDEQFAKKVLLSSDFQNLKYKISDCLESADSINFLAALNLRMNVQRNNSLEAS